MNKFYRGFIIILLAVYNFFMVVYLISDGLYLCMTAWSADCEIPHDSACKSIMAVVVRWYFASVAVVTTGMSIYRVDDVSQALFGLIVL